MKLKFWTFEYEFDRDDAKIVIPLALLLLALTFTALSPLWLLAAAAGYYALYFFGPTFVNSISQPFSSWREKRRMRCPNCKNHKIFLQGYQSYKSDELYPYYFCDSCKTTSILTDGGLLKI